MVLDVLMGGDRAVSMFLVVHQTDPPGFQGRTGTYVGADGFRTAQRPERCESTFLHVKPSQP